MAEGKEHAPGPRGLLDSKLLQFFDVLYRTRSVSRCADLLGQAQPTLSIWLGRLRRELNDPLFVRTGRGLEPTPRADALITTTRTAIDLLQRLTETEEAFDPGSSRRRFSMCLTDASHMTLMPLILRRPAGRTGRRFAPTALQIDADTGRKLASGEADLALGLIPDLDSGFYQQILYTQDWICLANAKNSALPGELITRDDYERAGHVGRDPWDRALSASSGAGCRGDQSEGDGRTSGFPGALGDPSFDRPHCNRSAAHRRDAGTGGWTADIFLSSCHSNIRGEAVLACALP